MLCYEGKLSLYCFTSAIFGLVLLWIFFDLGVFSYPIGFWTKTILLGVYYSVLNVIIRFKFTNKDYQVAVRATFLGILFALGVIIFQTCDEQYKPFGTYATLMAVFHYSEYLGIAFCNPKTLSPDSFILNHSVHYALAAAASWVEFFVEVYFYPELKTYRLLWLLGLLLCLGGEALRKLAMITASKNFSHIVQFERHQGHELVTFGVYSLMRHPSYVGWFWWSIGTQVVLANPVCFIIYTVASWKFFHDRIFMEEITLLNFFGDEYYKYQQRVPTGLPFIRGFKVEL
ncbi:protein-S-isoprenylcysteine O-methyltransferase isoform X2 [Toxorhynchites rutilus septentrionalis]|uniref:protein-S-isoprenylcysteine O-methyltransferase isoform X2 n=1 Tax=Toxorhynchites rutilus septentrionalis TaxID=329112 RepID=UPI00247B1F59|nr:protein-S-isoprenylcysteine O-methyltransferase isoform X2 [Toxorhynchites rutilus septentrionalis]